MESWVDIKKDNQVLKVPYQSFKDRFEHDGFHLVGSPSVSPTFCSSVDNDKENQNTELIKSQNREIVEPTKNDDGLKQLNKTNIGGVKNGLGKGNKARHKKQI